VGAEVVSPFVLVIANLPQYYRNSFVSGGGE